MSRRIVIGAALLLWLTAEARPQHGDAAAARTYCERGVRHLQAGELTLAVAFFTEAIELDPHLAEAFSHRAAAYHQAKDYARARDDYRAALAMDPDDLTALNHLAWLQATCPDARYRDGKSAVAHAMRACQQTNWRDQNSIAILAAAYAELGDFPTAMTLALESNNRSLSVYESRMPLRVPGLPETTDRNGRRAPLRAGF
jgi:Tfp pilus assembly protein PilF